MKKNLKNYSYTVILVIVLAVLVAVLAAASPYFFSWKNCRNILNQSAIYLVLSVGMTLVICAGQIDLSVGAVIGFSGMSMGNADQGRPPGLGGNTAWGLRLPHLSDW